MALSPRSICWLLSLAAAINLTTDYGTQKSNVFLLQPDGLQQSLDEQLAVPLRTAVLVNQRAVRHALGADHIDHALFVRDHAASMLRNRSMCARQCGGIFQGLVRPATPNRGNNVHDCALSEGCASSGVRESFRRVHYPTRSPCSENRHTGRTRHKPQVQSSAQGVGSVTASPTTAEESQLLHAKQAFTGHRADAVPFSHGVAHVHTKINSRLDKQFAVLNRRLECSSWDFKLEDLWNIAMSARRLMARRDLGHLVPCLFSCHDVINSGSPHLGCGWALNALTRESQEQRRSFPGLWKAGNFQGSRPREERDQEGSLGMSSRLAAAATRLTTAVAALVAVPPLLSRRAPKQVRRATVPTVLAMLATAVSATNVTNVNFRYNGTSAAWFTAPSDFDTFVESSAPIPSWSTTPLAIERSSATFGAQSSPGPVSTTLEPTPASTTGALFLPASTQQNLVTAQGNASSSAAPMTTPNLCPEGLAWIEESNISACRCAAGYAGTNQSCTACAAGEYKDYRGDGNCTTCPPDTWPSNVTASVDKTTCLPCPPPTFSTVEPMNRNGLYVNFVSVSIIGRACPRVVFEDGERTPSCDTSPSMSTAAANDSLVVLTSSTTLHAAACHQSNRSGATVSRSFQVTAGPSVEVSMTLGGDLQLANMTQHVMRVFSSSVAAQLGIHPARVSILEATEARRRLLAVSIKVRILASSSADAGLLLTESGKVGVGIEEAAATLGFVGVTASDPRVVILIPVPSPPTPPAPDTTTPAPSSPAPTAAEPSTTPGTTAAAVDDAEDEGSGISLWQILVIVLPLLCLIAGSSAYVAWRRAQVGTVARGPRVLPPPPQRSFTQPKPHSMAQAAAVFAAPPDSNSYIGLPGPGPGGVGGYQLSAASAARASPWAGLQLDTAQLAPAFHQIGSPQSPGSPQHPHPPRSQSPFMVSNFPPSVGIARAQWVV